MITELKIEKWSINDLVKWEKNPRSITKNGLNRLMEQIKKLGQYKPMVVNTGEFWGVRGQIAGGNMRYEALKALGITDVHVALISPKTENEFVEYALSDNDRAGFYDDDLLANLLPTFDIDWSLYAVDLREPTSMKALYDISMGAHEDQAPEVDNTNAPKSQFGKIYQLGVHRIMCGDSTKQNDVEALMGGKKAQMIFTDPPYMVDYHSPGGLTYDSKKYGGNNTIFNDNLSDKDALQFYIDVLNNLYKVTDDKCSLYWWFANKNNLINRIAWEETGWHMSQIVIWLKNSMVFSRGQDYHRMYEPCMMGWKNKKSHFKSRNVQTFTDVFNLDYNDFELLMDVWYQKRDSTVDYVHPTQKPVRLAERGIKKNSKIGDLIIDLFGGSGSTLIACHQMQRVCYAMELDPKYVDVIRKRYANYVGTGEAWEESTPEVK